jgi:glycerol-3-phosphate acyltransferase PlsY
MGFEAVLFVGAYLLGAVPFGVLVSRWLSARDPRELGSGNIGATNVLRSSGPGLGLLTLLCDGSKGWLPVWFALRLDFSPWAVSAVALAAFAGHLFPVYLCFRGGKGVATGAGLFLALAPAALAGSVLLFLAGVALSRFVSVGSLLAALGMPCFVGYFLGFHPYLALSAICSGAVLWSHRENISRLREGTETPLRF